MNKLLPILALLCFGLAQNLTEDNQDIESLIKKIELSEIKTANIATEFEKHQI